MMRRGKYWQWCGLAGYLMLLLAAQPLLASQTVTIGVLADGPVAEQQHQWQYLADYLNGLQPDWQVSLQVMPMDELDQAISHHRLDFVFTEPSHYTRLQRKSTHARALATVVRQADGQPLSALAGVIIARNGYSHVIDLKSLKGRRIAVMGREYLASYQAQLETLVHAGVPASHLENLLLVEPVGEAVVRAVLERRADAGFVRAGVIEAMAAAGRLALDEVQVIHRQSLPGYPYAVSTRLYPEWPFVVLPNASQDVARKITALLMSLESHSVLAKALDIHGFAPPEAYVAVADLARELRLPPFDQAPEFTFADIWSRYQLWIISLLLAGVVNLALLIALLVYNRAMRNARLKAEHSSEELVQSQERFDLAIKAFDGGLWDWNLVSNEVYFSPRWKTMLGYQEHELDNAFSTWELLVDPQDKAATLGVINDCLEGRRDGFMTEFRMRHKTDGWRVILSRAIIVRDPDGKPLRMVGTHVDISNRVQIEQELAEAQRIAHVGHWRYEHETQTLTTSAELQRIFEVELQEPGEESRMLMSRVHPDDRQRVREAIDAHYGQGADLYLEHRLLMPAGRIKYLLFRCETDYDSEGKSITTLGVVLDITHQKVLEERLRDSEAQANLIIDNSQDGLIVTDANGRMVRINPMVSEIFGYTREELLGREVEYLLSSEHAAGHKSMLSSYMKNPVPYSLHRNLSGKLLHGRRKDGSLLPLEINLSPFTLDGQTHVVASLRNISERLAAEQALKDSEAKLREERDFMDAVLEAAGSVIVVSDKDGLVVHFNRTAEEITGYKFQELRYQAIWNRLIPPERRYQIRRLFKRQQQEKMVGHYEFEWLMKDGSRRLFDWHNTVLTDANDDITYVIAQGYDITDKKAAEDALRSYQDHLEELVAERTRELDAARQEAERLLQVKSEFLANMSHEIRTPLNAVLGLAQVGLYDSAGNSNKSQQNYRRILDSGQHLLGLINDILDFSKVEAGKLILEHRPFRLADCIDRAVAYTADKANAQGLEFVVLEDPALPVEISGDITRLTQVLVNLLGNAAKFTEHGRLGFYISVEADNLLFNVTDTGIGMNEEQRTHLFAPFEQANSSTTRRFGGTGLGMAISKRLVDEMGGSISVYSWEGVGTSITVYLPLRQLNASQACITPSCRHLRVAGFTAMETESVEMVLQRAGIVTQPVALAQAYEELPADQPVLVSGSAFLSAGFIAQTRAAVARGVLVRVLCRDENKRCVEEELRAKLRVLDWPLRARHLNDAAGVPATVSTDVERLLGGRLKGLSILAAEDNDINRIVLGDLLRQEQATVRFAENGQLLLEIVASEGVEHFDVVLMDIQMPVMDGHETTHRLLARHPQIPVIGLTAHAQVEERERCLASGMVEHVTKPIQVDVLVDAILRHVGRPPTGHAPIATLQLSQDRPETVNAVQQSQLPDVEQAAVLIDWQALAERFAHRQAFIDKLTRISVESLLAARGKLDEAIATRNFQGLAFQAHSLKGAAGNIMANGLFELARQTETLAREEQREAWSQAGRLSGLLGQVLSALEERLQGDAAVLSE